MRKGLVHYISFTGQEVIASNLIRGWRTKNYNGDDKAVE